jgi:hypothetical protein|tara:strand:+ start:882 stop:1115 length:234 start_codon:yes stop_codon:yes gene_type:complete
MYNLTTKGKTMTIDNQKQTNKEVIFHDHLDDCKLLKDKEKVWLQVRPNVKSLFVVNIKEISYKQSKWEVTLTPYNGE